MCKESPAQAVALSTEQEREECEAIYKSRREEGQARAALSADAAPAIEAPDNSQADYDEQQELEYFKRWENEIPRLDGAGWDRASTDNSQAD